MEEWKDLFVASAGAAAALAGLLFVGVSINLTRILSLPHLPGRALQSLILLLCILIISLLLLVPHTSNNVMAAEIGLAGIVLWLIIFRSDSINYKLTPERFKKQYILNIVLGQLSVLPYVVSASVIYMQGEAGINWIVPGMVFSFIKALLDAWVMLVEINR